MSRDALVRAAAADARQLRALDLDGVTEAIFRSVDVAVTYALRSPGSLRLGVDGVSPFERELAAWIFEQIVHELWPQIVKAFARGAGVSPATRVKLAPPAGNAEVTARHLDSAGLGMLRETLQEKAWGAATRIAILARRLRNLQASRPAARRRGRAA